MTMKSKIGGPGFASPFPAYSFLPRSQTVFSLVAFGLAMGKGYYTLSQHWYPWHLQPHADWAQLTTPQTVFLMEALSTIGFLFCGA